LVSDADEVYSVGWFLFPDDQGGANDWMRSFNLIRMRTSLITVGCVSGSCAQPIPVGNVLHPNGQYDIGSVEVIAADEFSYTFLALADHDLAAGGMVTFSMSEESFGDGADVYLTVRAAQASSGSGRPCRSLHRRLRRCSHGR
jgi:hypothetical protein